MSIGTMPGTKVLVITGIKETLQPTARPVDARERKLMIIRRRRPSDIASSEITQEDVYLNRRTFLLSLIHI